MPLKLREILWKRWGAPGTTLDEVDARFLRLLSGSDEVKEHELLLQIQFKNFYGFTREQFAHVDALHVKLGERADPLREEFAAAVEKVYQQVRDTLWRKANYQWILREEDTAAKEFAAALGCKPHNSCMKLFAHTLCGKHYEGLHESCASVKLLLHLLLNFAKGKSRFEVEPAWTRYQHECIHRGQTVVRKNYAGEWAKYTALPGSFSKEQWVSAAMCQQYVVFGPFEEFGTDVGPPCASGEEIALKLSKKLYKHGLLYARGVVDMEMECVRYGLTVEKNSWVSISTQYGTPVTGVLKEEDESEIDGSALDVEDEHECDTWVSLVDNLFKMKRERTREWCEWMYHQLFESEC